MSASPYSGAEIKRSMAHFFLGKFASGLLNMIIIFWVVRLLTLNDYGAYVALGAGMELALALTSLGLAWVAARYMPEFRLHANGRQLALFTWQVITLISFFAFAGALLLFVAMPWLLVPLKLEQIMDVARLYLLVLMLESLRQNLQECILAPLLLQGQSQISQVVYNLTILLCLGVAAVQGAVQLHHVVLAELAGSVLGTIGSLRGVVRYLHAHRNLPGTDGWQPSNWRKMWRTAYHMYFGYLITLTYGQPVYALLIQRFLGVESTALFGFLLNLYRLICRYLPATLLFGMIRPKLMASFVDKGSMAQLTRNANLAGKLSLFVLMPILVFVWLTGNELLSLLSSGKFTQSGHYLGGLLLTLIPLSQRQIMETVAVACGRSGLCLWGSALGVLTLPLAYWLFELGQRLWSPIIALFIGQMIFNATIIVTMGLTTTYRPDVAGGFKLVAAALVGFVLGFLVKMAWTGSFESHANSFVGLLENVQAIFSEFLAKENPAQANGWLDLAIMAVLALVPYLLVSSFFKPFRMEERARLNHLLKRNIFIW
jgi:O-antigen/teichoic acid export membrane protein